MASQNAQSVSPLAPMGIEAALKAKEDPTFTARSKIFDEFALTDRVGLVSGEEPSEEFQASREYVRKLGNGARLEYICADVRNQELLWKTAENIGSKKQRFDFCIAAAGILKPHTNCLEYPAEQFKEVLEVNTAGD